MVRSYDSHLPDDHQEGASTLEMSLVEGFGHVALQVSMGLEVIHGSGVEISPVQE